MIYYLAKFIMSPAIWLYFRRSYFLGAGKIPREGPVIIIANHAASFLDAMMMGVMLRRPIHYYTRSDVFRSRVARFIFGHLHMIPIYSQDLGKGELHRNADSFDKGEEVLRRGGLLLIFPEGTSRIERNLLPMKKGVSRIALQALQKSQDIDIVVVPVGIHYSRHVFRSGLQLVTGDPVPIRHYRELYRENTAKAVNQLTTELEEHFEKVVLYVDQEGRTALIETQLEMMDNDRGNQFQWEDFNAQKNMCGNISRLDDELSGRIEQMQDKYISLLNQYQLHDRSFSKNKSIHLSFPALIVFLPLFAIGIVLNAIPYLFGRWMADKKVTRIDFYTSVLVSVSAFGYLIWAVIWLSVAFMLNAWWLFPIILLSPLLCWFCLWWYDRYRDLFCHRQYKKLSKNEPELISALALIRQKITNLIPD